MSLSTRTLLFFIVILFISLSALSLVQLNVIRDQNIRQIEKSLRAEADKVYFLLNSYEMTYATYEQVIIDYFKETGQIIQLPPKLRLETILLEEKKSTTPSPSSGRVWELRTINGKQYFSISSVLPVKHPHKGVNQELSIRQIIEPHAFLLLKSTVYRDLSVYNRKGQLLATSLGDSFSLYSGGPHKRSDPEGLPAFVSEAFQSGKHYYFDKASGNGEHFALYFPLSLSGQNWFILAILFPSDRVESALSRYTLVTIGLVFLVTCILGLFFYFTTRSNNRYMALLRNFTERISQGDFTLRLPDAGNDELATINKSLNSMATSLETMKNYEQELVVLDRLTSLATLSSGIAHEIKNPLMVIKYSTSHLKKNASREKVVEELQMVERNVLRMEKVVQRLADFSRPAEHEKKIRLDAVLILNESLYFLRKAFENHDITISIPDDLEPVVIKASKNALSQVFTNVLMNAIEAMPRGGEITITVRKRLTGDSTTCHEFVIRDTGEGIPEDNITRVLNPFFTTKASGTGLGLAIAHQIMADHGGFIKIRSEGMEKTTDQSGGTTIILGFTADGEINEKEDD